MGRGLRRNILQLLDAWEAGRVDERTVHEVAELLFENHFEALRSSGSDADAPVREALTELGVLNWQLIYEVDIPALRALLSGARGTERAALARWRHYSNAQDYDARSELLRGRPYYCVRTAAAPV